MAEKLEPAKIICQGGLDTRLDVVTFNEGGAVSLQNFEPGLQGGYRRINGTTKRIELEVTGTGPVLCIAIYKNSDIIAIREVSDESIVYVWSGASWDQINDDTRLVPVDRYRFWKYTWDKKKIIFVDGTNPAAIWDGTDWTVIDGSGAPDDPSCVTEFKSHIIYGGYTAGPGRISISAPDDENDFDAADGAVEFNVGDVVVGLRSFRDQVVIFCKTSMHILTGSGIADFQVQPVSKDLGCISADSIQEVNGDIVYLAPDGIRTVSATLRIGDFELGNIAKKIQSVLNTFTSEHISSVLVPSKSQYRLFYSESGTPDADSLGVLGGLRLSLDSTTATATGSQVPHWEFSKLKGIKPFCCDSDRINSIEVILHGGWDGFIYQQEAGISFDGAEIEAIYRTPDVDFKDPGKRKFLHRVTSYIRREGQSAITLNVYYNYDSNQVLQPASYELFGGAGDSVYGVGIYGVARYGARPDILQRQPVEGSGFTMAIQFYSKSAVDSAYSVEAFMLEAQMAGRR